MAGATPKPIYVLAGSDATLRREKQDQLVADLIGQADPQTCLSTHDATALLADVLDELRTLPFLAPHRVVIVRDAEAFISANRDALEAYLDRPAASGTLILTVGNFDSRTRLAKKVPKVGEIIACDSPDERALPGYIRELASRSGKQFQPAAVQLLADWIGSDVGQLRREIEKLATYVGERESVTPADVEAVVTATAGPQAFAVANALTDGDTAAALKALAEAMTTRGAEFQLLGGLAWRVRQALQVAQAMATGMSANQAMSTAGVRYPPHRKSLQAYLRHRRLPQLRRDMQRILQADLAMKSGVRPDQAMQQLVVQLCTEEAS